MKKTLSLVLVLTMMLSLFSFTTASAEAPVEINILAQIWTPYEEEQRDVFAKLEEACNVKLNIVSASVCTPPSLPASCLI